MSNKKQIPSNSMELKQLAELAAAKGFSWVAQDGVTQRWYGYITQPEYQECSQEWRPTSNNFEELNLPDDTDYSKQLFNVNELLNNEQ